MQASTVDYLAAIGWALAGKGRKPKPITRPGRVREEAKPLRVEQLKKELAAPRRPITTKELMEVTQYG